MKFEDMKPVSTTYEAVVGDHVYRAIVGPQDVMIKRTPVRDHPLWSHGTITQAYDAVAGEFVPMVKLENPRLSHDAADAVLASIEEPAPVPAGPGR